MTSVSYCLSSAPYTYTTTLRPAQPCTTQVLTLGNSSASLTRSRLPLLHPCTSRVSNVCEHASLNAANPDIDTPSMPCRLSQRRLLQCSARRCSPTSVNLTHHVRLSQRRLGQPLATSLRPASANSPYKPFLKCSSKKAQCSYRSEGSRCRCLRNTGSTCDGIGSAAVQEDQAVQAAPHCHQGAVCKRSTGVHAQLLQLRAPCGDGLKAPVCHLWAPAGSTGLLIVLLCRQAC